MQNTPALGPLLSLPKNYICYRANGPVDIDGRLDKPVWLGGPEYAGEVDFLHGGGVPWTEFFVDIEGEIRPQPRFRTRVKMLWDDDYFYIGAWLEEPHIWATLTEHDSVIFQDNDFEVFIDPDGDNHQYYEIEINALNTEWDLRLVKPYRDGGPALNEWEIPGLKTAVHIDGTLNDPTDTDRSWSVEMALPWAALAEFANCPCPPRDGDQWRINFSRVEWDIEIVDGQYRKIPNRPEHNWVWSPQGVIDMHRPERWGYVQFSSDPVGQAVFQPDTTGLTRDFLMKLYYMQREFRQQHSRWAGSSAELGCPDTDEMPFPVDFRLTKQGYTIFTYCPLNEKGKIGRLYINQDSRLWTGQRKV